VPFYFSNVLSIAAFFKRRKVVNFPHQCDRDKKALPHFFICDKEKELLVNQSRFRGKCSQKVHI